MRIVSRTARSALERSRAEAQRRRAAAAALGSAYPGLERVHVELRFATRSGPAPASQLHALYPPAPAFFEFGCPFGDCDGTFDLNGVLLPMLAKSAGSASGCLTCTGTRASAGQHRLACRLKLDFRAFARYGRIA